MSDKNIEGPVAEPASKTDFIRSMVSEDLRSGKYGDRVVTRFPPEPNGYLHIGHAKSICLNFGIAEENPGAACHLRFDDTNPETEDMKYVDVIERDVKWLGFDWGERRYFASDYFHELHDYAVKLIEAGRAYVDSQSLEEIREQRGTIKEPGTEGPFRNRSVAENLDLFRRMRAGEFKDGEHVLRAKADMAAKNMVMRDPVLYRIRHAGHYRAGDEWCIYPLYDFTHCLSDAIENITHSLCTLEFKDNRALYDWVLDAAEIDRPRPEQTEFARLNIDYAVLSKRKLIQLVEAGHVDGWDDPRMLTVAGLRRRGVTPAAIRKFCDMIGVARVDSRVDMEKLEYAIRDDLNVRVPRVMCVLRPVKMVITNYPEEDVEELDAPLYPRDVPKEGSRNVPFSRELYIERDDFMEDPPKQFFRLAPGREVRLRYAYFVKCTDVIKDPASGEITEIHCTYDPETLGGAAPDGRKVKGTIHWVSAAHSHPCEVRLYDRLFTAQNPDDAPAGLDFTANLNPESKVVLSKSRIEPSVVNDPAGTRYQFERAGYFVSDSVDSRADALVFNRIVGLRDTWGRAQVQVKPDRGGKRDKQKDQEKREAPSAELSPAAMHFAEVHGVGADHARVVAEDGALLALFEQAVAAHDHPRALAAWLVEELPRTFRGGVKGKLPFTGAELGALVELVDDQTISRSAAKKVFAEMLDGAGDPAAIVERQGLRQVSDSGTIDPIVDTLMSEYPQKVEEYRGGRTGLLGFFVGEVMKRSGGVANPEVVKDSVRTKLG